MITPKVLLVSDNVFIPELKRALNSLCVMAPQLPRIVYALNWEDEQVQTLKKRYRLYKVIRHSEKFRTKEHQRAFAANIRARVIFELLNSGEGPILYLDADSCIRKPLDGLCELMSQYDLVVHQRSHKNKERKQKEHTRLAVGVLGWKQNERAIAAASQWADAIIPQKFEWFTDQIMLYRTIQSNPDLRVGNLPKHYIDWDFEEDSAIWAAKGPRKRTDSYAKECEKFRKEFCDRGFTEKG